MVKRKENSMMQAYILDQAWPYVPGGSNKFKLWPHSVESCLKICAGKTTILIQWRDDDNVLNELVIDETKKPTITTPEIHRIVFSDKPDLENQLRSTIDLIFKQHQQ